MGTPSQRRSRRAKTGGSKLSKRQHKRLNPVSRLNRINVTHPIVKKHWKSEKTLKQNFEGLGLTLDPNAGAAAKAKLAAEVPGDVLEEMERTEAEPTAAVQELQAAADAVTPRVAYIPRGEMMFVHRLIEKHGEDFKAMARDHGMNTHQHTPAQLRRKAKRYYATRALLEKTAPQAEAEA